eukprot:2674118-Amphidinium_carterae.1
MVNNVSMPVGVPSHSRTQRLLGDVHTSQVSEKNTSTENPKRRKIVELLCTAQVDLVGLLLGGVGQ